MINVNRLVDSVGLANHFGVSVGTVRKWARDGVVPSFRVSRRVIRFRIREVESVLSGRSAHQPTHTTKGS